MEDLMDDDFGDLYADVEVQAISSFNSTNFYTHPQHQQEEVHNNNNNNNNNNIENPKSVSISNLEPSKSDEDSEEDDDDDLNIVLNDEDWKGFHDNGNGSGGGCEEEEVEDDGGFGGVKNGSGKVGLDPNGNGYEGERVNGVKGGYNSQYLQFKHVRPYGPSFPSHKKVNESPAMVSYPSKYARGDWDKECKQHKVLNSGQVANLRATANSVVSHGGYGFSLPWYRTILDVNIDAFEDKRWRYPGVDISDFFNFGLSEESWKLYCISLEQFRQQSYLHSRISFQERPKLNQTYENGYEHKIVAQEAMAEDIIQVGSSSNSADQEERQLGLPKGRAIQVEDGTGERQPTMELKCPRGWDSDVVIQINVQDSNENLSHSGGEELGHRDGAGQEAPKSGDSNMDDFRDVHHSGSTNGDELSAASHEGNIRACSLKRSSQPMSKSHKKPIDSDNHANNQDSDADVNPHQKVNAQTPEAISESMGMVEKEEEEIGRKICESDQCLIETESSLGDRSHFSPTLSYSESYWEESRDTVCGTSEESHSPLRRSSSGTELHKSVASDLHSPKSNGDTRKAGNTQNSSRSKSPIRKVWEHKNEKLHRVAEWRICPDNENGTSPISRCHSSIDCNRQFERLHDYNYRNEEKFSHYRQRDVYCGYDAERSADNHVHVIYHDYPHRKYQVFRDERKQRDRRSWNEEHSHKRSFRVDNQDDMDRGWYTCGRGLLPEGTIPLSYRESGQLVSEYNNVREGDIQRQAKSDKLHFGKGTNYNKSLLDKKIGDDLRSQKYGRSMSLTNWKRGSLDEKCKTHYSHMRKEKLSGRWVRYDSGCDMGLDSPWGMKNDDEYHKPDHQHLSSWSRRESYTTNEERWLDMMSSRSEMFESGLSQRYGRQICDEEVRDNGCIGTYSDAPYAEDGIVYPDDQVHFKRRRHSWRSKVLHQIQNESILRHHDDEFYVKRTSWSFGKNSRHENVHAKYRSAYGGMVDDMQLEQHKYKKIREESSANCVNRNPSVRYIDKHGQKVRRSTSPVDLVVGEGKSSGRCSNGRSIKCSSKLERMDMKDAEMMTISKVFYESQPGKAFQTDISKIEGSQDSEKWLDKFLVTESNKVLDIEEGQIITEEPNVEDNLGKKHVSETATPKNNVTKRNFHSESASSGNEIKRKNDDQRILETLAKMEKRRERFKDPIALKKEPDKTPKPQVDFIVDSVETKQERPARKRRWVGN